MSKIEKFYQKILSGLADSNIRFADLQTLLSSLGFEHRMKGGHYIYFRNDINEIINLQPKGSKAKPYQVKQVREIIQKYQLKYKGKDDE
jgi:virulence-associated protein VapD